MSLKSKLRVDVILIAITLLAAFLNIFNIWNDLYSNSYYTSSVTSMLQSFHNFFFASFDPAGYITVDKPPVTFWIQTLFAYIFGVHGWSLILPEALAGVGSVMLLYKLVKPSFGLAAARWASLIMACTPVAVAVSRTNNIDSILVFTLLIATWMLFKGIREPKVSWVLGSFAMIGIAFNEKMLQAYMIVPAFYLFYLLAFKCEWKKKLAVLVLATVFLLGVSLSWAVIVDSIPEANRPYIGGSETNSVLELALGYNGISRLTGMNNGGPTAGNKNGETPSLPTIQDDDQGRQPGAVPDENRADGTIPDNNGPGGYPPDGFRNGVDDRDDGDRGNMPIAGGNAPQRQGFGGGMFGTGQAGPLRLFQSELSGQASWLLPFVGFGCIALLAGLRRKKPLTNKEQETLFWLAWLLPAMAFFSVAGFFHQYYLIMLAPPIAALAGAGWAEMWNSCRQKDGWRKHLLPLALLATAAFELYILYPYQQTTGTDWLIGIGAAEMVLVLLLILASHKEKIASYSAAAGLMVLLAGPLYWAATPMLYGDNSVMPQAGPSGTGIGQKAGSGAMKSSVNTNLIAYLEKNNTGEKFLFATTDANTAGPYIIETGKAVMAMGGFSGNDSVLTVEELKQMVKSGELKYFMISGGADFRGGGGNREVLAWIRSNSTEITSATWQGEPSNSDVMGRGESKSLYLINKSSVY